MTAYVFTGPTLSSTDAREVLDAVYLPPVAQGDVYDVAQKRPTAIGIIDGYFQQVPSVWHKEILWAMAQGIHVFGSASIGALRAADLHQFGMRGVGRIFEAYRDGEIADDDEVAVIHGPCELNYVALCEPLINMRCTLRAAAAAGIVSERTHDRLIALAKKVFYQQRTYEHLIDLAFDTALPQREIAALELWLGGNRIDLKRDDALRMLHEMREFLNDASGPMDVAYVLENTGTWSRR
jgi:hypothetical protein